jgi:hypothetical protein
MAFGRNYSLVDDVDLDNGMYLVTSDIVLLEHRVAPRNDYCVSYVSLLRNGHLRIHERLVALRAFRRTTIFTAPSLCRLKV